MVEKLPSPPDVVTDLAASCVRFVQQAVGIELDFTQDTLPVLDHYVAAAGELPEDLLGLLGPACGAYFGEVVRRHVAEGRWECPGEEYATWRLVLPSASLSFNPVGLAVEVTTGKEAEGWGAHFQVAPDDREPAREAAGRLGEVSEEDYYTFGVRFDVLAQVYETVRRRPPSAGSA